MAQPRVAGRHAQQLVVAAGLVAHVEHADRARPDQAAGERRLLQQHQRVERVAVLTERALDVPVVGRVPGRGEQHAVEADAAGLVVDLVLVALSLGDLDRDVELHSPVPLPLVVGATAMVAVSMIAVARGRCTARGVRTRVTFASVPHPGHARSRGVDAQPVPTRRPVGRRRPRRAGPRRLRDSRRPRRRARRPHHLGATGGCDGASDAERPRAADGPACAARALRPGTGALERRTRPAAGAAARLCLARAQRVGRGRRRPLRRAAARPRRRPRARAGVHHQAAHRCGRLDDRRWRHPPRDSRGAGRDPGRDRARGRRRRPARHGGVAGGADRRPRRPGDAGRAGGVGA